MSFNTESLPTNKNITTSIQDLYNDSDPLSLDGSSFMFGLGLAGDNGLHGFDDTYITVSMTYKTGTIDSNSVLNLWLL